MLTPSADLANSAKAQMASTRCQRHYQSLVTAQMFEIVKSLQLRRRSSNCSGKETIRLAKVVIDMVQIGRINKLRVKKRSEFGLYLDGGGRGEILLPRRYCPEAAHIGDEFDVFVHYDSEDRLVATTERPLAQVGDCARLIVKSVETVGAFLDWGLGKDLLLPFSEQTRDLKPGSPVVVFVYLDKSDRISSSMRLDRYLDESPPDYTIDEKVSLFVVARTDLGFKAIINGRHLGLLYENEVFRPIAYGDAMSGYIKAVRPDGKIDLILDPPGHQAADEIGERILEALRENQGVLAITSKTSAEDIYELFGVSKKKYKIALGGLYKNRLITIDDDGIRLV